VASGAPSPEVEDVEDEDDEPLGFLDAMADVETAMPEMNDRLTAMAELIVEFGGLAEAGAADLDRAETASQRLAKVRRFSKTFMDLVRRYDQELVEFESRVATIGVAIEVVFAHIQLAPDREEANDFLTVIVSMGSSAAEARDEGITGFGISLESLEHMSRDLRPAVRLLRSDIERTVRSFTEVGRWGQRAAAVLDPDDASELD
jgi:hypothetical protein